MTPRVSLRAIAQALDDRFGDSSLWLDRRNGEVTELPDDDDLIDAEELESLHDEVESSDHFVALPDRFDVHEPAIMQRFAQQLDDAAARDQLLVALGGRGAFRMFRATTERLGLREAWFGFRFDAMVEIAREWLEAEGIAYDDDVAR